MDIPHRTRRSIKLAPLSINKVNNNNTNTNKASKANNNSPMGTAAMVEDFPATGEIPIMAARTMGII